MRAASYNQVLSTGISGITTNQTENQMINYLNNHQAVLLKTITIPKNLSHLT